MEILNELFSNRCEYDSWFSIFETKCTNSLIYDFFSNNSELFLRLYNCFAKEPLFSTVFASVSIIFGVLGNVLGSKM